MPQGATLRSLLSEIRLDKLSRNGDMGADPPGCFDAPEHPEQLQTMDIALDTDPQNIYILVRDYSLVIPSFEEGGVQLIQAMLWGGTIVPVRISMPMLPVR